MLPIYCAIFLEERQSPKDDDDTLLQNSTRLLFLVENSIHFSAFLFFRQVDAFRYSFPLPTYFSLGRIIKCRLGSLEPLSKGFFIQNTFYSLGSNYLSSVLAYQRVGRFLRDNDFAQQFTFCVLGLVDWHASVSNYHCRCNE